MIKPAILYKEQIEKGMQSYFYTTDMLYETGGIGQWCPTIADEPEDGRYQWAIIDTQDKLIGFLDYRIDFYSSNVYNFGLFSFDRCNALVGKELFDKMEELLSRFHRIEWRAVEGNPACRGYDRFIAKHNGNKYVLKDSIKDTDGNYRANIIYEIINKGV